MSQPPHGPGPQQPGGHPEQPYTNQQQPQQWGAQNQPQPGQQPQQNWNQQQPYPQGPGQFQPAGGPQPSGATGLNALAPQKKTMWIAAIASTAVMLVGCLGTWASVGAFSVSGVQGDGTIVLILAIVAAGALAGAVFAKGDFTKYLPWVAVGAAGLAALLCIIALINISSAGNEFVTPSIGWGLILATLASIACAVTSFMFGRK